MKIVHLLPHFADDGNGVVYAATDLAYAQSAAGHSVACVGDRAGPLIGLLEGGGVACSVIPRFKSKWALNPVALFQLTQVLKSFRPEVVHAHTIPTAVAAKLLKPFVGYSLVTSVHNGPRFRNLFLGVGDSVICVSTAVAKYLEKLSLFAGKLQVVRNGPLGSPRKSGFPAPTADVVNKPAILTLAALHAHKGLDDLVDAFAIARKSVPNLSLYILGEGPEKRQLKARAERLACKDHIHFMGFVRDPRSFLAKADAFVLPSHMEAFGLSLAEAREAGCAVIGTRIGGIPEVLENGRHGILVPAKNSPELARVLVELFTNKEALRLWQDRARSNLAWLHVDRVCRETLGVYSRLIEGTGRATASKQRTLLRKFRI